MKSIRKFPVGTTGKLESGAGSEFVVPQMPPIDGGGFRGVRSGRVWLLGAVSYVGRDVTVEDVLAKCTKKCLTSTGAATEAMVREFIQQLHGFKVGNVISIEYNAQGEFALLLEKTRPTGTRIPLPR